MMRESGHRAVGMGVEDLEERDEGGVQMLEWLKKGEWKE
jgi:hypothetical protein